MEVIRKHFLQYTTTKHETSFLSLQITTNNCFIYILHNLHNLHNNKNIINNYYTNKGCRKVREGLGVSRWSLKNC